MIKLWNCYEKNTSLTGFGWFNGNQLSAPGGNFRFPPDDKMTVRFEAKCRKIRPTAEHGFSGTCSPSKYEYRQCQNAIKCKHCTFLTFISWSSGDCTIHISKCCLCTFCIRSLSHLWDNQHHEILDNSPERKMCILIWNVFVTEWEITTWPFGLRL
jgi:hypothetical protein